MLKKLKHLLNSHGFRTTLSTLLFIAICLSGCAILSKSNSGRVEPSFHITAGSMNILYEGINNPINIIVDNGSLENYIVECSDTGALKLIDQHYVINPKPKSRQLKILISKKEGDSMVIIRGHTFRVRPVTRPYGQLGGVTESNQVSRPMILANQEILALTDPGFPYHLEYEVSSFRVTCYYSDPTTPTYTSQIKGAKITMEMKEHFRKLSKGDRLIIDEIRVKEKTYGVEQVAHPVNLLLD